MKTQFTFCLLISHLLISGVMSTTFTVTNNCDYPVWPGILANANAPSLSTTGFSLRKGETKSVTAPASWGGRFWGRTRCTTDSTSGKFSCVTGDCGSGKVECSGSGAAPPATLAEFTLDGYGGQDFYDVSLVDGYNIAMVVVPQGGSGQNCSSTGCVVDLNGACPSELKVTSSDGKGVACKSACEAFNQPQYCCDGAYGSPETCKPTSYSEIFKSACPRAYSYAYDDKSSTFTCSSSPDYLITFCPSPNASQKSSQGGLQNSNDTSSTSANNTTPLINSTMVYEGASNLEQNGAYVAAARSHSITGLVGTTLSAWLVTMLFNLS